MLRQTFPSTIHPPTAIVKPRGPNGDDPGIDKPRGAIAWGAWGEGEIELSDSDPCRPHVDEPLTQIYPGLLTPHLELAPLLTPPTPFIGCCSTSRFRYLKRLLNSI
ncbi:hypothetical protein J6590_025094 [Homalodisca vitripennis]|nr:hypothetical protein J6590_025094 [Homalodisca vitripennis]